MSRSLVCLSLFLMCACSRGAEMTPSAPALVRQIKVQPDKAPDCSSLKAMAESVTRECKTNDEKAIAIYNFMQLTHYHRQYPVEAGGVPVLKEINTYGWSLCGGLHAEESALWKELGWGWRFVGWDGHTTVEARYDGAWHYLDVFLKFYAWRPDANAPGGRTIASEDDLTANAQTLLSDAFVLDKSRGAVYAVNNQFQLINDKANWTAPAFLSCGDTIKGVLGGLKTHKVAGPENGWAGINHASGNYSADIDLAPGFSLTSNWQPVENGWFWAGSKIAPQHTCGNKDLRNSPDAGLILEPYVERARSYADGTLRCAPDFSNAAVLNSFTAKTNATFAGGALVPEKAGEAASVTVLLSSPYLMTKATGRAEGADGFEISVDEGKTFHAAPITDFSDAVRGHVSALARVSFTTALKALTLELLVQNNPGSLPYLSPGKNVIHVSVADPAALGENTLVVTYAYAPGFRARSFEQLCAEGKEVSKQHNATWANTPTIVQKTFNAKDLPATFEIDVPTPKDAFPVYPRMLFMRREVLAPGSKRQTLPENAQRPAVVPNDELKTLPNPFLIGTQAAPARAVKPSKTTRVELSAGPFVAKDGTTLNSDFIKWPKNAAEENKVPSIVLLIGGVKELPALNSISAARLVFSARQAHDAAPAKVALVALKKPLEAGAKFDFADLGETLGSVIVPAMKKGESEWNPPKEFKLDVTHAIKALRANNAPFAGAALRIVPDRGVDDGYTVRVNLSSAPHIFLEFDTAVDAPTK